MPVDLALSDGVATVTIDRPDKRNALDAAHYAALSEAFVRIRDDDAIRCAILTGSGDRAFCAGADIGAWLGRERRLKDLWATQAGPLPSRGLEIWKPVIAAINGACIGGGMTLLMATDIRVAARHATFSLPEGRRGVIAANGGTQRLLRQLPHAVAMKMLLLGDTMSAEDAGRWGFVTDVVEGDRVMDTAMGYARRIAAAAPLAVQAAKELAIRSQDLTLAEGLRMEQLVQHALLASLDATEGRAAFAERREPVFGGH
ncbi:enoyl-CoA hydratase/isomerase family protein [Wenxinia marina]|uniref:Enoyl-CoA hydratase/carnithine racemase n=1 Tax=Wenxinia marina DSM 24838 TaxID=1123501 RepID=A0A0D0NPA6_9RHOB|nr:enoyl-CoA hydratase-related protein [Wenxinia marina]KIQ70125.1 Enoyl-CoA hydratase/carnithine racemase [Wenxinia marina DSM 24838]GGL80839.1 putative enoyl-CoA hydratase/isomerase [Wenxinia marina]